MSTNLTTTLTEERNTAGARLDVKLHDLLRAPSTQRARVRAAEPLTLPTPVFPQHPELLTDVALPSDAHGALDNPYARRWRAPDILRTMSGWLFPYLKSRVLPGDFHPIIAYLFTEWKCNLDCHYCWAFDNSVKGMTEDVAKRSIDWLHASGLRLLALMGEQAQAGGVQPVNRAFGHVLRHALYGVIECPAVMAIKVTFPLCKQIRDDRVKVAGEEPRFEIRRAQGLPVPPGLPSCVLGTGLAC